MKNSEKDYLIVAKAQSEDKILELHWERVSRTGIWISSEGEETKIKHLDTSHLISIIKMLLRFNEEKPKKSLNNLITVLLDELYVRTKM